MYNVIKLFENSKTIREEFIGFSALQTLDAVGIATSILTSVEKYCLDMNKLVGLGFDGCSVMAGKENGVQKIICDKYSKATFFHSSVFSSLKASRREDEFLNIFRVTAYFGHLVTMWSIDRSTLYASHCGAGSLVMRNDFNTYEKWLQQCINIKQTIENELISSSKLRETMFVPQNKTINDLLAQNDKVNYGLRRRIYDTERIKNELEWQKWNMLTDKDKFLKEIEKLENALYRKLNPKMLVETRCEERLYRAGVEMCLDKTTTGLHKEQFELDNTIKMLNDKLNKTKALHNILIEQINVLDEELKNKTHALDVDQKCLQYRVQLDGRSCS
ncbi:tektin-B1-like [Acyrthosiphon pisum]|uniref:Tektin n=1 Tax=Acyrthosiphon pisum TaxID=7029 RepID=A0A8R2NL03_ACYPI|nr:tektin-B1-like [Acyrthosiphon pisum]